jgi:hypothetical protein
MIFNLDQTPDDKPLLLLDVDGVINVFNHNHNSRLYLRHTAHTNQGSFRLKIRTDLKDHLAKLAEHYHLVWCTMWDEEANEHIGPLVGLPSLPYLPVSGHQKGVVYAENNRQLHRKVPSIVARVDDRRFAWVDDELSLADHAWADRRSLAVPTHVEKTDERQGLIDHQVKRLVVWAQSLKEDKEA